MKKILFLMILSLFAVNTSSWAQSDTLPNDLGKQVNTPEGLKKVIDSKDSKFAIVDVRDESAYNRGHIPTAINVPNGGERLQADGYKYIFVWGGIKNWPYELETSK